MNKLIVDALDLLVTTDRGIEQVVDTLLREADIHGQEAEKLRGETVATLRRAREQVVAGTGGAVERVAAEAFRRLDLPNRGDLQRLTSAVEALRLEIDGLRERVDRLAENRAAREQGA